jgi:hypothetical protein
MHESRSCSLSFAACFSIAFCRALFFVAVGFCFPDSDTAVLATGGLAVWTFGEAEAAIICSADVALAGFWEDGSAGAFLEDAAGDDSVAG